MDHEVLASELVRALRGKRSQQAVNRRLGRSSNVAHTWERGTRQPRASDFFRLARLSRVDVDAVRAGFASTEPGDARVLGSQSGPIATWLRLLARNRSQLELAKKVGRDRNTVARWFSGASEPRLPDLLRLVDATTQRLMDFVAAFVDPRSLPSLRVAHADLELQRRLAYELPWTHAVLRLLELDAYRLLPRHVRGFVSDRIGISLEQEDECLRALARAGQIHRRRGKWRVGRVLTVDTREDPAANLGLKRHWAKVGLERLGQRALPAGSLYSYNLFAISEAGLEEIRQAHLQYFERLRAIVGECERPTRLALVNIQLLPLDVPPEQGDAPIRHATARAPRQDGHAPRPHPTSRDDSRPV
jgi:transcriptional regulator with XRE-family HTH domain